MLFIYSSRKCVTDPDTTSVPTEIGMPPLVFAHSPTPRKLKFLDFSPNKTRVIADIGGGLPQTQVTLSSMTANSNVSGDYGDPYYALTHDSVQETVVKSLPPS
jgi:hypothetical protein